MFSVNYRARNVGKDGQEVQLRQKARKSRCIYSTCSYFQCIEEGRGQYDCLSSQDVTKTIRRCVSYQLTRVGRGGGNCVGGDNESADVFFFWGGGGLSLLYTTQSNNISKQNCHPLIQKMRNKNTS